MHLHRSNQKSTRQGINLNNEEQQKPTTSHVQPLYGYNVGIWNGNSPALSSLLGHNGTFLLLLLTNQYFFHSIMKFPL